MTNGGVEWTPDGFTTPLAKRDEDRWWGFVEPTASGGLRSLEHSAIVAFPLFFLDMLWHWYTAAPWARWSLSLSRGQLVLRMRGRRRVQPLVQLGRLRVDDYGLLLLFDNGIQWSIPPQPAALVDIDALAEHLRVAASTERRAEPERAAEALRAKRALRDLRDAPERDRP